MKRQTLKRVLPALLCLAVLLASFIPAGLAADAGSSAAEGNCSLTVEYYAEHNGSSSPLNNAQFYLYKVAEADSSGAMNPGTYSQGFEDCGVVLDYHTSSNNDWTEAAEKLAGIVSSSSPRIRYQQNKATADGRLTFDGLDHGLYLVMGSRTSLIDVAYSAQPLCIILPSPDPHTGEMSDSCTAWPKPVSSEIRSGSLTVSKTVAGEEGDPEKLWNFTVTLSDPFLNGTCGGMTFTDGIARFSLRHGESRTASGLPAGTAYTVAEEGADAESSPDGYMTEVTGGTGTVQPDQESAAAFTNTKPAPEPVTGDLLVSKKVTGTGAGIDWHFTAVLDNTAVNGIYGDMTFVNGTARFTLKSGESKTAAGLPAGASYSVTETEANRNGYTTSSEGDTGTIRKNETAEARFANTNTAEVPKNGGLTVTKTVPDGDLERNWHFAVTLEDPGISGPYGAMMFRNGTAEFVLRHGESLSAADLPAGMHYEVTELEANQDGFRTSAPGSSGTVPAGGNAEVVFTNSASSDGTDTGSLEISKTVTGAGDRDRVWTFHVRLNDTAANREFPAVLTSADGTAEDAGVLFTGQEASVSLKHGETIRITDLPAGDAYTVTEDPDADYTSVSTGASGIIPKSGTARAEFTNSRTVEQKLPEGSLSVTKTVTGVNADRNRIWHFRVFLGSTAVSGQYGDMLFTDGIAEFAMPSGGTFTAYGLPAGTAYTVTETEADQDGYCTSPAGAAGIIPPGGTAEASFVNSTEPPQNTETGGLSVRKTAGGDVDTDREWHFTVTLDDTTVSGQYGDMLFADGTARFTLRHGETKKASGLPAGAAYAVLESEADRDGLKTWSSGSNGRIPADETASAKFTNTTEEDTRQTGGLTLRKTLNGISPDRDRKWHFTVVLDDSTITGQFGDIFFVNGIGSASLTGGETCTVSGIPEGTAYTVEEMEANQGGYLAGQFGDAGIIQGNRNSEAAFVNTRLSLPLKDEIEINGEPVSPVSEREVPGFTLFTFEPVSRGSLVTYALNWLNTNTDSSGNPSAADILIEDPIDGGLDFISAGVDGREELLLEPGKDESEGYGWKITKTVNSENITAVRWEHSAEAEESGTVYLTCRVNGDADLYWQYGIEDGDLDGFHIDPDRQDGSIVNRAAVSVMPPGSLARSRSPVRRILRVLGADDGDGSVKYYTDIMENCLSSSLIVTKTVSGNLGAVWKDWDFTVTLDDASINGVFGGMSFENGTARFTLKSGKSKAATGLPAGTGYTVTETEADMDGYTASFTPSASGTLPGKGVACVEVSNTKNAEPPPDPEKGCGNLLVTKVVSGTAGEPEREWHFTVTVNPPLSGDYGGIRFENGTASFTLKHDGSAALRNLPAGTRYAVTEAEADADGYAVIAEGDTGTIPDGGTACAKFENHRDSPGTPPPEDESGNLAVTKTVTGSAGDPEKEFHFAVVLDDRSVSGTYGSMEFADGTAEFSLKGGQTMGAIGLPEGTGYTVLEIEADRDGYATESSGATGTVPAGGTAFARFVNSRQDDSPPDSPPDEPPGSTPGHTSGTPSDSPSDSRPPTDSPPGNSPGSSTDTSSSSPPAGPPDHPADSSADLTVSKTVTGAGDKTKEWHFTVTLDGSSISGTYGAMTFQDGRAEFTLKHGESARADGLPAGASYTVAEQEADSGGYMTASDGASGTLGSGTSVHFANFLDSGVPQTGDSSHPALWITLLLLSAAGLTLLCITPLLRRKK